MIHTGDALTVLRKMPSGSVHCCITSPPYFGLRDYGTAKWKGGDKDCDHKAAFQSRESRPLGKMHGGCATIDAGTNIRGGDCRKCGARRIDKQLGLERTPELYVARLVEIFREVRRVLRDDGTCWINLGDSYTASKRGSGGASKKQCSNAGSRYGSRQFALSNGLKPKDLIGIPWRVAFALQADGWYLRSDVIWAKPNPMPESVGDRPTKSHEYFFLLSKSARYFYDAAAISEPLSTIQNGFHRGIRDAYTVSERNDGGTLKGDRHPAGGRNRRTVWTICTRPFKGAHFATFPLGLVEPALLAGTSEHGVCADCGAPWVRGISVQSRPNAPSCKGKYDGKGKHRTVSGGVTNDFRVKTFDGWLPSCKCFPAVVPATVLDPFAGAATVGLVAAQHGREFIGIELNPAYVRLANTRLRTDALRMAA